MSSEKIDLGTLPRVLLAVGASSVRGRILLALRASESASFASLQRTAEVSIALHLDVHVVRIVSRLATWPHPARSPEALMLDDAVTMHAARRTTRAKLGSLLGRELPWSHHHVLTGSFVEGVARHAMEVGARLIVLPGHEPTGSSAVSILRRSAAFVLVARSCTADRVILADADCESVDEVLSVARRFDADLIVAQVPSPAWLPHSLVKNAASELIDRTPVSVLLTPPSRHVWPGLA